MIKKILLLLVLVAFVLVPNAIAQTGQMVSTQPQIVNKAAMKVVGLSSDYGMTNCYDGLMSQWSTFPSKASSISSPKNKTTYIGLSIPRSWTKFSYVTGMEVTDSSSVPAGMVAEDVAANKYAKFVYKGDLKQYQKESDLIFDKYLKDAKLKYNSKAPVIEIITASNFTPGNKSAANNVIEVYVPIK